TSRFSKRSASRKSLLRPRRPRLDKACARWSVPDIRPAPSRFSQLGFQYCSSAPQTGLQYCAVDSITTSSTCCWISHSANRCNCSGLLPYQRRSNWYSSSTSTSATTTASFFLCTSIPRYPIRHKLLLAGAESVPKITLSRVSGYRRSHRGETTPIYSLYHARSGSDRRSASASPLITQSRHSQPFWIIVKLSAIFMRLRGHVGPC